MNILKQRDTKWKDIKIGKSNSTIGGFGCTLTCLAMLADTTPDVVNSELTSVNGFLEDKIIWTAINKTGLKISFPDMGRAYSYDNDRVKQAIDKNGGCLVEVDFDGVISTPNDRHWILFVGNGKAYDPWTGTEIYTTKYPIVKGYCIINKLIKQENDMLTEEQKRILDFLNGKSEGDVREAFGALAEKPSKDGQIATLSQKVLELDSITKKLQEQIDILTSEVKSNNEIILDWQQKFQTANEQVSNATEQVNTITDERNKYRRLYENLLSNTVDKMSAAELIKIGLLKLLGKK
jgi:hypothetical protein